ncbi:MAG: hypothetical protein VX000_18180 [Myxococcota bacterium]|nr:hypothetical protein [Myxococcota bacterium]
MKRHPSPCPSILVLLPLAFGCTDKTEKQAFPAGLEPLGALEARCSGAVGEVTTVNGQSETFDWTHGCGTLETTLEDVYLALQDTVVAVDQRSVDEWTREDGVEPEYDVSFALQNTVYDIITVEFETTWRAGALVADDKDGMSEIGARYQMTAAPQVITLIEGSVYAANNGDGTVEVQINDHLDALRGGTDITELKVSDLFADIDAHTRGDPIPSHRE